MPTFLKKPRTFSPAPALFPKHGMVDLLVVPTTFRTDGDESMPGVSISTGDPERLLFAMTLWSAEVLIGELQRAIDEAETDGNA